MASAAPWTGTAPLLDVRAWVQRDDTAPGHAFGGRQSYFDDPRYRRFDGCGRALADDPVCNFSIVRRRGTISAVATGRYPIVVAGFRGVDRSPSPRISAGSALAPLDRGAPSKHGPDASLAVDGTPSHHGLLGAGTRSNSCVAMSGSSVAAPLATAQVAEWLIYGSQADRHKLFNASKWEDTPPQPPPALDADLGGGGRLSVGLHRRPR